MHYLTKKILTVMALLCAGLIPTAAPASTPPIDKENPPVGEWIWMDKTVLKIEKDGSASRQEASGNQLVGKWTWDDKKKLSFHIDWSHKVTVWFTMTSDLARIAGSNSNGVKVAAVRAGVKEPVVAAKDPSPKGTPAPSARPPSSQPPSDAFGRRLN